MQKLEIRCMGHLAPINERCGNCHVDLHNQHCPDYKKVGLQIFEVKEQPDYQKEPMQPEEKYL